MPTSEPVHRLPPAASLSLSLSLLLFVLFSPNLTASRLRERLHLQHRRVYFCLFAGVGAFLIIFILFVSAWCREAHGNEGAPVNVIHCRLIPPPPHTPPSTGGAAGLRRSDLDAGSEVQSHLRALARDVLTCGGPRVRRK